MIPRKIRKPALSLGHILSLLAIGLLVVAVWTAALPIWIRGGLGLLIASAGLFVTFGRWVGRPASKMLSVAIRYLLRPRRWAWARAQRSSLMGTVRRPPTWWWRLVGRIMAFPLPSHQVIVAIVVTSIVTMLIGSVVGVNMWARANAESVPTALPVALANPTPHTPPVVPTAAPTAAPAPTPVPPTPTVAPTSVPVLVHSAAVWQGGALPGHLRLSPSAGPVTVTLVFVGTDVHTHTLWLAQDTIVPLVPAFHPTAAEAQVWSAAPVRVEQGLYAPRQCPTAGAWWVWMDAGFSPPRLVLYPRGGRDAIVRLPDGETAALAARRNAFSYHEGLYEITASQPFCLEVWFEN
jgi:hypothetical protein